MSHKVSCSVIVLTHNEEANLGFLLKSVVEWAEAVYVVDSGSTDATVEIAKSYGAQVYFHPWKTYADQLNWALDELPITTEWVMRMDADEYVTDELAKEISEKIPTLPPDIMGLHLKRRVHFMGRWIKHGSYYPTWLLRIFRNKMGRCEALWMDEHIVLLSGTARRLEHDIVDENHKGLSFWTVKHEKYAQRELLDLLALNEGSQANEIKAALFGEQDRRKRWLKNNFYSRSPLFIRALLYFLYRYLLRLGFLDGVEGLIFHFLQGFWYRFYVDAKLWEFMKKHPDFNHEDHKDHEDNILKNLRDLRDLRG